VRGPFLRPLPVPNSWPEAGRISRCSRRSSIATARRVCCQLEAGSATMSAAPTRAGRRTMVAEPEVRLDQYSAGGSAAGAGAGAA
jgi:hypothetical protein